jgi:hypothetical protein
MGEDARRKSDGQRVKIGTCESMYYLRFDQRGDVEYRWPALSDDPDRLDPFLYRFPDPKEDGTLPGDFDGAWGGIKLSLDTFWSSFEPDAVDHGSIQAKAHDGYLFNLPCPEGNPDMYVTKYDGTKPHRFRNGGTTTVVINAQRWYAGRLVLVVQCAACRHSIRLVDLEQVQPILDALKKYADGHREMATRDYLLGGPGTPPRIMEQLKANELRDAAYWDEVAARIVAGYNQAA